jgi:hypothetical protein
VAKRAASSAECRLNLQVNPAAHRTSRCAAGIAVLQRQARRHFRGARVIDLKDPSGSLDKARHREQTRPSVSAGLGADNLRRAQAHTRVPVPARNDMWAHRPADLGVDSRHRPKV